MEIVLTITPTSQITREQNDRREDHRQRMGLMMQLAQPLLTYFQDIITGGSKTPAQAQPVTPGTAGEILHVLVPELDRDVVAGILRKTATAMSTADWEKLGERLVRMADRFDVEDLAKLYDELTAQRRAMGLQ